MNRFDSTSMMNELFARDRDEAFKNHVTMMYEHGYVVKIPHGGQDPRWANIRGGSNTRGGQNTRGWSNTRGIFKYPRWPIYPWWPKILVVAKIPVMVQILEMVKIFLVANYTRDVLKTSEKAR